MILARNRARRQRTDRERDREQTEIEVEARADTQIAHTPRYTRILRQMCLSSGLTAPVSVVESRNSACQTLFWALPQTTLHAYSIKPGGELNNFHFMIYRNELFIYVTRRLHCSTRSLFRKLKIN